MVPPSTPVCAPDENPWETLRTIKHHVRRTPLQMLLRGQNLVDIVTIATRS